MAHSTRSTRSRKENKLGVNFESGEKEISILPDVENEREEVISILPDKEEVFKKVNEKNCHNEDCENVLIKAEPEELDSVLNNEGTSDNEMENDDKVDKREGNQKEGKNMEFTYIEGNENEESDDLTGDESEDPLDVFPFVEIKVEGEPMEEDKDNMAPTDANASTSQDMQSLCESICKNPALEQYEVLTNSYGLSKETLNSLETPTEFFNDLEEHMCSKQKPYKCKWCDYSARRLHSLKHHYRLHTGERPYKCTVCDYCASRSDTLKKHMNIHTGEKPYKCPICDLSTSQSSALKEHMSVHTGLRPFKCTLCNYSASRSSTLTNHMRAHTGERPHKCTVCDFSASRPSVLKEHMNIHTGEKSYKCSECAYSSAQSHLLKEHMRMHSGKRPYKCTVCDYSASRSDTLTHHMRRHTGEKPYKCSMCVYSASQLGALKGHMSTHTGVKPHTCTVCKYSFFHSSALKKHMKIHNKKKKKSSKAGRGRSNKV